MTFVPSSSFFSGSVSGTVAVSNFPGDQLVHFTQPVTVDVDNFPADQLVHFAQPVAVTGPLTAAELTAAGLATEDTLDKANSALNDVALTAILERDRMATE